MAPRKNKRSRREETSLDRSSRSSSSSSSSNTPPPCERRKGTSHSSNSSRSRTIEVDVLKKALSGLFVEQSARPPASSTFGGDSLPPFNPEDATLTIETWCTKVEELRRMYRWNEQTTIHFALTKLRGLASTWYKSLPTINFSWEEWKSKLIQAFPTRRNYCDLLHIMLNRRKRADETYVRYYYEKLSLLNLCQITGKNAVSCIIGGITEAHIGVAANAGNFADPEGLYTYLSTLEDRQQPSTSSMYSTHRHGKIFKKREHRRERGFKIHAATANPSRPSSMDTPRTCFVCGKAGHMKQQCPIKDIRECKICGKKGHHEDRCYQKHPPNPVA